MSTGNGTRRKASTASKKKRSYADEFSYAYEKFGPAARTLATSPKDLHQRLFDGAYHIGNVRPHQMPESLQDDFVELKQALNSKGSLLDTVSELKTREAVAIAKSIWRLYETLTNPSSDKE